MQRERTTAIKLDFFTDLQRSDHRKITSRHFQAFALTRAAHARGVVSTTKTSKLSRPAMTAAATDPARTCSGGQGGQCLSSHSHATTAEWERFCHAALPMRNNTMRVYGTLDAANCPRRIQRRHEGD